MLKVLEQSIDKKSVTFIFDKCYSDNDIQNNIHSLVVKVKKPIEFNIVFDSTTPVTIQSLLTNNYIVSSKLTSLLLTGYEEFEDGVYEFDYYLLYKNKHNITTAVNSNIIYATPYTEIVDEESGATVVRHILDEFLYTDKIYINDKVYFIDKQLSTLDELVLTQPLDVVTTTYKIIKDTDTGFFSLYRDFNNWLIDKINELTSCVSCTGKIIETTKLITYILGLIQNTDCQDLSGASTIFNYIKQVQKDDNCC